VTACTVWLSSFSALFTWCEWGASAYV